MRRRMLLLALAVAFGSVLPAEAAKKSYSADRFDSRIQVLPGGAVEVTETVVFRFSGTFTEVFRRLPQRLTDGIQIVSASADGIALTRGKGPSQYDVSDKDGQRVVRWHFAPFSDTVRTLELTYIVRGVVQQDPRGDLFEWRALPSRHDYPIGESTITIDLPGAPLHTPTVKRSRVGSMDVSVEDNRITTRAASIRPNGWLEASVVLAAGSVIDTPPEWQRAEIRGRQLAPGFATAAGVLFVAGLIVLFALRQGYDSPVRHDHSVGTGPALPDTYPPAIAGALTANGRPSFEHAMAALFALADRRAITITEGPKKWGQHNFDIERGSRAVAVAEHEQVLLDALFSEPGEDKVSLGKARSRIGRRFRKFSAAVEREMHRDGLLDDGRARVRKRYMVAGLVMLIAGIAGVIPAAILIQRYGPWLLLVPAALVVVGLIGMIMYAAHTSLSNEGLRRSREWRGFQRYMREVTRDRAALPESDAVRLLPFVVGVGLAHGWSSYLKKHRGAVPPWFQAIHADRGAESFAFFVYSGGSGVSGGAGGGGAAGGGASGAS